MTSMLFSMLKAGAAVLFQVGFMNSSVGSSVEICDLWKGSADATRRQSGAPATSQRRSSAETIDGVRLLSPGCAFRGNSPCVGGKLGAEL